eukprot:5618404-Karenia_brevis.AAC.1
MNKIPVRFVAAYFPHSGYTDWHIQKMYDSLREVRKDAISKRRHVIIGADFNAQVGIGEDADKTTASGKHALNPPNARGQ